MKHFILFISILLFTLGTATAQSKLDQDKSSISIYPNPAISTVTIKFDHPSKASSVSIYSIIGNEVMSKKLDGSQKTNFNVQGLKKGKYIVRVFNQDGSTETQSLIKN
ncbi:T9SS type A sorting domain-containing protein [Empedobacter stercoris]|mgnify:CR=1 FL=1|uniref:T9SS type A sorting domain-containing protein n=1 Tax=Empedobacter falsenii TaxID=343874 RepID=A0ABY8V6T3_9FLAO|nr:MULTISPECIES: T9SS type A sorting domain-containing protein [Empedobacter]MCA4777745.1 T9SS type A sorting domain-containing protein [Empedobacter stercoris]MCA4809454.1 T9SS type A sorting domain-containing protein [Empedobacter stercoris]MDM1523501.1 T9SS type A sorting domain-containing protein [Empedobacter sp. 225-1]MDM1543500.1 T9SS type A sorting domain-containing protein [Empedobacter sp. 189-2]QNT14593.1 T9SS type A sorting domain-containing protein [Empedobacter stercoris]